MSLIATTFSSCLPLCSVVTIFCESSDGKCISLLGGPFDTCTKAGYNNTLPLREEVTDSLLSDLSRYLPYFIRAWENCSSVELGAALECSFYFPKCNSEGKRVLPCRRVCGELLKRCLNHPGQADYREVLMNFVLAQCLSLPNETASSKKCFEPPNFASNDSVPSPLDRGCQKLIFPACKNLGIYQHTLFSESVQKKFYKWLYNRL
ncbi:uncharacterized protein LOC110039917, partial [Orbicella faveolata]|uniref:uncharacterized protein LOC110039917 n=1 Tax=Orbicella faveolata TaxID=48498 RepID=UPI0009E358ED